jgi:hypothetical protein
MSSLHTHTQLGPERTVLVRAVEGKLTFSGQVADQRHEMRIRIRLFLLMQVPILLLIKVMCESATTGLQTLQGSNLSLHASIVIISGRPRLNYESLKLRKFDLNADAAFHS